MNKKVISLESNIKKIVLDNGLTVYINSKNTFHHSYAILTTKYGSLYNKYYYNKKEYSHPEGLAHYIEHLIFSCNGIDVNDVFASLGADVNAYTSLDKTSFMYSTTSNHLECLKLLLDFVFNASFTSSQLKKEKNIILEELAMYYDKPNYVSRMVLLNAMYDTHPVKGEIGGNINTLELITKKDILEAYKHFYNTHNMSLVISGNINYDEVIELLNNYPFKKYKQIIPQLMLEKEEFNNIIKESSIPFNTSLDKVTIGIKIDSNLYNDSKTLEIEKYLEIIFDIYLGESSIYYQQLIQDNIIDYSFYYEIVIDSTYGYLFVSSDTQDTTTCINRLKEIFKMIQNETFSIQSFNHYKKVVISEMIRGFNNFDYVSDCISDYHIYGLDYIEEVSKIYSLDYYECLSMRSLFDENNMCISILNKESK